MTANLRAIVENVTLAGTGTSTSVTVWGNVGQTGEQDITAVPRA